MTLALTKEKTKKKIRQHHHTSKWKRREIKWIKWKHSFMNVLCIQLKVMQKENLDFYDSSGDGGGGGNRDDDDGSSWC